MDTPDTSHTVDLRPPSLWRDVRAGVAGLPPRVALSLASGAALAAIVLAAIGMLGLFDSSFIRVIQAPEGMFSALALGAFLWCVVLSLIWGTYYYNAKRLLQKCITRCPTRRCTRLPVLGSRPERDS